MCFSMQRDLAGCKIITILIAVSLAPIFLGSLLVN